MHFEEYFVDEETAWTINETIYPEAASFPSARLDENSRERAV